MILSQKGLVLRFMFIAFYRLKEDLLRDAEDIFLYLYELLYVSARGFFRFFDGVVRNGWRGWRRKPSARRGVWAVVVLVCQRTRCAAFWRVVFGY